MNGAGHHVPRRQLGRRVISRHERLAVAVHQPRALAAQGLGRQGRGVAADIDGGGMELDELRIGDLRAGQGGEAQTLAPQLGRSRSHGIETADTARGQNHGRRDNLGQLSALFDQHAPDAAAVVLQEAAQALARPDLDVRMGKRRRGDSGHDGATGLVALDPRHAGPAVGGFQAEEERPLGVSIEGRAQLGQPADGRCPLCRQQGRALRIDQTGAGGHSICGVQSRVVVLRQGRGHAALGPGRGATLVERGAGEHHDLARGRRQGGREAGEPGADDEDAVVPDAGRHQISSTST